MAFFGMRVEPKEPKEIRTATREVAPLFAAIRKLAYAFFLKYLMRISWREMKSGQNLFK